MEFIFAKSGGFCPGVKKAVDTAMSIPPENVYVFGEIIHNPDVVRAIAERGITTVHELDAVPNGATLIIRSHGVGRAVYEECKRRDITVVDCTCEFVRRTQRIVDEHGFTEEACNLNKAELEKEYEFVGFANVTVMQAYMLEKGKRYRDMTANNINHPNDFAQRLYAQVILAALLGKDFDL